MRRVILNLSYQVGGTARVGWFGYNCIGASLLYYFWLPEQVEVYKR